MKLLIVEDDPHMAYLLGYLGEKERFTVEKIADGRQALARIGAAALLAVKGKTVLVKPNIVSGSPAPTTTSPAVVHAVCDWLRRQGAKTVWVG